MLATLGGLEESFPAGLPPEVVAPLRAQVEEHRSALAVASTDARPPLSSPGSASG